MITETAIQTANERMKIRRALARIEEKLDALMAALANDEDEPEEGRTLDGEPAGRQREEQPL